MQRALVPILLKSAVLCLLLPCCFTDAEARTWTNKEGKSLEAEIVKVHPDRTVELKLANGRTATVPFSTFADEDVRFLEERLKQPAELHPVTWEQMNQLLGMPLWSDFNLLDDACAEVAERIELEQESKTDYLENYRAYPLGQSTLFGEPVYAIALYGHDKTTDSLSLVFLNQGDIPYGISPAEMEEQIETCGDRIRTAIEQQIGEPERDSLGKDDLREKVWRWDWNGQAILLSLQTGKYVAVRIMPSDRADRAGRIEKLKDDDLKRRMAACVERRGNGDVIIRNIPMINQGPKGYCMPATWERYLRYMDIPVDMYLLALAANTGVGGGTYAADMTRATGNIINSNGRKLAGCGKTPDVRTVSKQIDKGLPILWTLLSTPSFQRAAMLNTARRNGIEIEASGQNEDTSVSGHICLIIGYNDQTGEIAISDSWGPSYAERWVPADRAEKVSYGEMNIIKW